MQRFRTWLSWLDSHLLLILAAFLFAFIPLFPKIPLFDILPGYIVRVRAEDFLVFLTGLVWLGQVLRKKVEWKTSVFFFVLAYILLGLASMLLGSVLTQTIPPHLIHIGKSALHFFRYLEYFSLFFFTYSAVKTKEHIKLFVGVLALTVIAVAMYGAGQKYLNWPLYSTMNREYSKGEALYLSEFARVQSTFAGHYDLTAYLVLVLPILFALALSYSDRRVQALLALSQLVGVWLLLLGSSKGSLAAYIVTIALVLILKFRSVNKSITTILKWSVLGSIGCIALAIGILFVAPDLYKTIANVSKPISPIYSLLVKIDGKLPADSPLKLVQTNVTAESTVKPDDVYVDVPDFVKVSTTSATGEPTYILVEQERTWSDNSLKYGLSMGIRLDTLWPQAFRGLMKNPLTGSGYATLNKGESSVYTEADSTDNNFLRTLGETGLLGFSIFFGLVLYLFLTARKNLSTSDEYLSALNTGYLAGVVGLMINAITIDVFAASKVAFTFWAISGFVYASGRVLSAEKAATTERKNLHSVLSFLKAHSFVLLAVTVFFFAIYQNPFTEKSAILNFAANVNGAEAITTARCFLRSGALELCRNGETLSTTVPSFYAAFLVPFLKLYNNPGMFFIANSMYIFAILILFYSVVQKISSNRILLLGGIVLLLSSPSFITSTAIPSGTLWPLFLAVLLLLFVYFSEETMRSFPKMRQPIHILSKIIGALSVAVFALTFLNTQQLETTLNRFRGIQSNWRNMSITQINNFFYDSIIGEKATLDATKTPFLITATNPYYVDMFSNGMYSLLPLYQQQRHMDRASEVWGEDNYSNLIDLYAQKLSTNPVYLSDVDILSEDTKTAFDHIHDAFDLSVSRIGCNYHCILYELHPETKPESTQPTSIDGQTQLLETLPEDYSFSVVSTRFDPEVNIPLMSLQSLVSVYSAANKQASFTIVTGDVLTKYDQSQLAALSSLYTATGATQPLLFSPGNFDLLPKKEPVAVAKSFFTNSEFFLFITPQSDGVIGEDQQVEILNALLTLEKMPNIKTVFVVSNQANWIGYSAELQDLSEISVSHSPKSKDIFMISQVIPQLAQMSDKEINFIAGDLQATSEVQAFEKHIPNTNLHFFNSRVAGLTTDRFLHFTKDSLDWKATSISMEKNN